MFNLNDKLRENGNPYNDIIKIIKECTATVLSISKKHLMKPIKLITKLDLEGRVNSYKIRF